MEDKALDLLDRLMGVTRKEHYTEADIQCVLIIAKDISKAYYNSSISVMEYEYLRNEIGRTIMYIYNDMEYVAKYGEDE